MSEFNGIEWSHFIGGETLKKTKESLLILEFCRKGHVDWDGGFHPCNRLEIGELLIYNEKSSKNFQRSKDYCGDKIVFYKDSKSFIRKHFDSFKIDVQSLIQKFCSSDRPFIVHTKEEISSAFNKLENKSKYLQAEYEKLALLELLITLKHLDIQRESICRECNLSSMQVDKIYCIRSFICENMGNHFTIEELADKFDMPPTAMKICFKNVFGLPVFTYARRERMKMAAKALRDTDHGILQIAGLVGYNNGSKFAHAFQDVMGMTPKEYRKKYRLTSVA